MKITVEDGKLLVKLDNLAGGTQKALDKTLFLAGNVIETEAKKNLDKQVYSKKAGLYKRTGALKQSVILSKKSDGVEVKVGKAYGKWVEEGAGEPIGHKAWYTTWGGVLPKVIRMKGFEPRPFFKPAIQKGKKELPKIYKQQIKKLL